MDARLICCMLRQVKWSVPVTGSTSASGCTVTWPAPPTTIVDVDGRWLPGNQTAYSIPWLSASTQTDSSAMKQFLEIAKLEQPAEARNPRTYIPFCENFTTFHTARKLGNPGPGAGDETDKGKRISARYGLSTLHVSRFQESGRWKQVET